MKKIFAIVPITATLAAIVFSTSTPITASPLPPFSDPDSAPIALSSTTAMPIITTPTALAAPDPSSRFPVSLSIPSIKLAAAITPVGTDSDGAMSVPTMLKTVGWYKDGTIPGDPGSAVLDAHVYLAFKTLKNIKVGASIYVAAASGKPLRFIVSAIKMYPYLQVPAQTLFAQADGAAHLNLITCSGTWLPQQNTYNQRLVVYTTLAS